MENMHISHTEIIVITVKCPLMEFGLANASTVCPETRLYCECVLFNIHLGMVLRLGYLR